MKNGLTGYVNIFYDILKFKTKTHVRLPSVLTLRITVRSLDMYGTSLKENVLRWLPTFHTIRNPVLFLA